MFVGREAELQQLTEVFAQPGKQAVMLYGRRRVGKSTLILEAIKNIACKVIYYECLMTSLEDNLRSLEAKVKACYNNKFLHFVDFEELFEFLGSQQEKVIIIIDEYTYLKKTSDAHYIDSLFQRIVDSLKNNIDLVLLGSYVGMMKELLQQENPLFGRFSLILHIRPFDYYDASLFYTELSASAKPALYAVFGGSPFVNVLIDEEENLEGNIERLLLNANSPVSIYMEYILLAELSKVANANMILSALANGKKRYGEIEQLISGNSNGSLDKQLKNLLEMEIIQKVYPINKKNDKKKTFYEISDNLVRFYYAYIYNKRDVIARIGTKNFYELYIKSSIKTFISHRYEAIVREYFSRQLREGKRSDVYDIGTFWYDMPKERRSGEFDCVLELKNGYAFYEVKYYDKTFSRAEAEAEVQQLKNVLSFMEVSRLGFVALSGFDFTSSEYELISGEELYKYK